jgi:NAD(P)-dependent dehydrogenase (short-subunit alcohol dehydrogenase family)
VTTYRDRVAIVTGAASGIGLALSQQLARRGAIVTLVDVDRAPLEEAAQALASAGMRARAAVDDVTDRDAVEEVVESAVSEFGRLDFLFNNAGIGVGGEARDFAYADWKQVIDVNLFGVIHGVAAAYPLMVRQGYGHIVNIASLAGLTPLAGEISYVASKYAVVGLSHTLRAEAADLGVKVSVVCPGKIETPIYDTSRVINFDREAIFALWPTGISPERCAEIILRGVERNKATIVVTRFAKLLWALQRLSPTAMIWAMQRYMRRMREYRIDGLEG